MTNQAIWKKCDFQLHTCRDPNWTGERPVGVGDELNGNILDQTRVDELRDAWADKFVEACSNKKLRAIGVTDHHEMVMIPYIKNAIKRFQAGDPSFSLWLFPGMELTAKNGVQCLILFDAELEDQWLDQAIGALNINHAEIDPKTKQGPKVTQLNIDYSELSLPLENHSGLKGRFVILPNVSKGGKHTVLKDGWGKQLRSANYVGGYLDNDQTINSLGHKNTTRLSGETKDWSSRFMYPIPTSDSRDSSFSNVGSNNTWIKLSAPTAEAIRQAFLASQSRISITPPATPSLFVEGVNINGSKILRPSEVGLSSQLNSIIGGRGSGKSTFVEYLAFGLGRSCYDLNKDQFSGAQRLKDLIAEILVSKGGSIDVFVRQDGALFQISRSPKNNYVPTIKYPDGTEQSMATKELRGLFSAVVYSQNELAELGKRTGGKSDIADLLRFLNPDYKRQYDELLVNIDAQKSLLKQTLRDLKTFWVTQAKIHKLKTQKNSIEQRVAALAKSLPDLSDSDKAVIAHYEKAEKLDDGRKAAKKEIDEVLVELSAFESLPVGAASFDNANALQADDLKTAYSSFCDRFNQGLKGFSETIKQDASSFEVENKKWLPSFEEAKNKRNTVLEKLSEHKNSTDQIIKLKEVIRELSEQISDGEGKLKKSEGSEKKYFDRIAELQSISEKMSEFIEHRSNEIEELSNKKIKAQISKQGDYSEIFDAVEAVASKTGSVSTTRQNELKKLMEEPDSWSVLNQLCAEALSILRWELVGAIESEERPKVPKLEQTIGSTESIQSKLFEGMDIDKVASLAASTFKPSSSFTYCDNGKEIAFDKASEGQRAGALLFMLLHQAGGPLIIDQPEGDLDNKIISELTDVLHEAKEKRQLIFVSHNANIVVNGSSEFVGYLDVSDDSKREFTATGAIDSLDICNAITSNMEGGEKAFKDRQLKYGF